MTDLLPTTSVQIVNPIQGDVVTLDDSTERLGEYLADVREFESLLREAKKAVSREVLRRMDAAAKWTEYAGGLKLTGSSPTPTEEFDGPMLHEALGVLVDEGVITVEALDAAVETVIRYEPRKRGITQLRKLGGRVARVIDACSQEVDRERRVSVSRA